MKTIILLAFLLAGSGVPPTGEDFQTADLRSTSRIREVRQTGQHDMGFLSSRSSKGKGQLSERLVLNRRQRRDHILCFLRLLLFKGNARCANKINNRSLNRVRASFTIVVRFPRGPRLRRVKWFLTLPTLC